MTELLARITAGNFTAGLILTNDRVTTAAPIVAYMAGWSRDRVRDYCTRKG